MENFTNAVLLPEDLPEIENNSFNPIDRRYLKILFIRLSIFVLISLAGFIALLFLPDEEIPGKAIITIACVLTGIFIYAFVLTYLSFPRKGYLVRENDISFQKGLIVYKVTSVPFNRIQHVEVNQGVLAKAFKISSIKLFTAGGSSSDLSIPGLPVETAQNLKEFLSNQISEHE